MKEIDLSVCIEFLPELEKNQKYVMQKNQYFIYAGDSITNPQIIYFHVDKSSYYEWYVIEDFDYKMPTTDSCEVVSITLFNYNWTDEAVGNITDQGIIDDVIKAKNNKGDISKIITTEKYGEWNVIFVNYKDSPFSERIGFLNEEGIFEYEKSWEEHYKEAPAGYLTENSRNHFW